MTKIGTREDWLAARTPLLAREKEHTRLADEIAQQRRELPWVALEKEYRFDTEAGPRTLAELFDGRSQLIVYHFMFGPDYTAGCATCSSTADSFNGVLPHLKARDASSYESDFNLDFGVSVGDQAHDAVPLLLANEVAAFPLLGDQQVRDSLPPVATQNADATGTDIAGYFSEGHGVGTFARDGSNVYHCYSSYARGTEFLMGYYAILDRTPKGRDENGEMWLRRHDEYDA